MPRRPHEIDARLKTVPQWTRAGDRYAGIRVRTFPDSIASGPHRLRRRGRGTITVLAVHYRKVTFLWSQRRGVTESISPVRRRRTSRDDGDRQL